jgi:hypothetical protein
MNSAQIPTPQPAAIGGRNNGVVARVGNLKSRFKQSENPFKWFIWLGTFNTNQTEESLAKQNITLEQEAERLKTLLEMIFSPTHFVNSLVFTTRGRPDTNFSPQHDIRSCNTTIQVEVGTTGKLHAHTLTKIEFRRGVDLRIKYGSVRNDFLVMLGYKGYMHFERTHDMAKTLEDYIMKNALDDASDSEDEIVVNDTVAQQTTNNGVIDHESIIASVDTVQL